MKFLRSLLFFISGFSLCSYANVHVTVMGCNGVIFKMPGMTDDQKALVLTNGHCIGIGSFRTIYPDHKEIFIDKFVNYSYVTSIQWPNESFSYGKILFATMTYVDLAIIELETTYNELMEREHLIYSIAREIPHPETILEFNSHNKSTTDICEVDKIISVLKQGPWTWINSIRMKYSEQCHLIPGQSGTAGIEPKSGVIYGLVQTRSGGDTSCTLHNPCEVNTDKNIISTGVKFQPYAVAVAPLYDCYDESISSFDFNLNSCFLNSKFFTTREY